MVLFPQACCARLQEFSIFIEGSDPIVDVSMSVTYISSLSFEAREEIPN